MNTPNVHALTGLLLECSGPYSSPGQMAQYLASEGVLVPSALTDEEIRRRLLASGLMVDGRLAAKVSSDQPVNFDGIRQVLECIAKGDPA
jgi:hypothetical protein